MLSRGAAGAENERVGGAASSKQRACLWDGADDIHLRREGNALKF